MWTDNLVQNLLGLAAAVYMITSIVHAVTYDSKKLTIMGGTKHPPVELTDEDREKYRAQETEPIDPELPF